MFSCLADISYEGHTVERRAGLARCFDAQRYRPLPSGWVVNISDKGSRDWNTYNRADRRGVVADA
jgi:hypothetical protein